MKDNKGKQNGQEIVPRYRGKEGTIAKLHTAAKQAILVISAIPPRVQCRRGKINIKRREKDNRKLRGNRGKKQMIAGVSGCRRIGQDLVHAGLDGYRADFSEKGTYCEPK